MSGVMMKSGVVQRYTRGQRANHWAIAILFMLLAASGLAFFHPAFYFLSNLLGGGPWARILHPFLGVVMFVAFFALALQLWNDNRIQPHDREWGKHLRAIIDNTESNLPEIGKYNLGQKYLFWLLVWSMVLLLASGIVLWRPYFAPIFPIPVIRIAAVVHALAGFAIVLGIIVHIYAAIWVKGTVRAMTRGVVSHAWAKHHHPLWYRKVTGNAK